MGLEKREKTISDSAFKTFRIVPFCLDTLLSDNAVDSIDELRQLIEWQTLNEQNHIVCLTTQQGIYTYEVNLNSLIGGQKKEDFYAEELGIAQGYWQLRKTDPVRTSFSPGKIKVVIHVRNGDTVTFGFRDKVVSVFGRTAQILERENDICESRRKPVKLESIAALLKQFEQPEKNDCSILFISDGYGRAIEVIIKVLLRGEIRLGILDGLSLLSRIFRLDRELRHELNYYEAASIIGESRENLLASIHAIAEANIIIMSTGGFAYSVYRFFNIDPATQIGNINTLSLDDIKAFKASFRTWD